MDSESPNQALAHTLKVVVLNEFVKVNTEALKRDKEMLSKDTVVFYSDDIVLIISVMMVKVLKDFQFYACLILELLLISYDFDSNLFFCFVIKAFDCLTKGSLAKELKNLVSKTKMILKDHLIISLVIIITMIENVHLFQSLLMSLDILW